ncbi:hypothetical protein FBU31_000378 [Coemansia sp. 'formosensis']|nr:hypothetical protein FBU31_000378 [Coemansia sp. 'formosensis']
MGETKEKDKDPEQAGPLAPAASVLKPVDTQEPDSLPILDKTYIEHYRFIANLFKENAPTFSGEEDERSAHKWEVDICKEFETGFDGIPNSACYNLAFKKLTGTAAKMIKHTEERMLASLFAAVEDAFPMLHHTECMLKDLCSGKAFGSETCTTVIATAKRMLKEVGAVHSGPEALALALESICPMLWVMQHVKSTTVMHEALLTAINSFKVALDGSMMIPLNFGMATKPKTSAASKTDGKTPAQTKAPAESSAPKSKGAKRHQKWAAAAKDMKCVLANLKADLAHHGQAAAPTPEAAPTVKVGGTIVKAVVDLGTELSLVTLEATNRLGLPVHTTWHPWLIPAWSQNPYTTEGFVNVQVEIANGPKHWTKAAVVRQPQKWDMLLKELDVELVTLAMRKHQQGEMAATATFIVEVDNLTAPEAPETQVPDDAPRPVTDEDYADFPAPESAANYVVDDSPIELLPDVGAAARAESADTRLIQPRKMRVKLGLPADYFVKDRDADFHKWNALYPAVTCEEVAGRIHKVSEAAYQAHEEFVKIRLERGIDEPTQAHSQMPVFTWPKPNTTARRVLFDDSANNCLNMIHTGIELLTWYEIVAFLDAVVILTLVDLGSFFMTIRLHKDVRDHWAYQAGSHHCLHTNRLVQGNSESPAIAQAFLEHVLGSIPKLQGKLLIYIDNIYLKSTDSDMAEHICLIGVMTRALAEYNLLLNLKKSMFAATRGVEVLGMMWSADGSWKVPDWCIETLQDLPMPRTVSEIWHLAGGINSISRHLPWVQVALLPFYQLTGRSRLTKDDLAELEPHWQTLRNFILNVEHLYIPP